MKECMLEMLFVRSAWCLSRLGGAARTKSVPVSLSARDVAVSRWLDLCLFVLIHSDPRGSVTSWPSTNDQSPLSILHHPATKHCPLPPPPNTERNTKWPTMKSDFRLDKADQMLMYSTGDTFAQHLRHAEWDGSLNSHECSKFWSEISGSEWNQRHLWRAGLHFHIFGLKIS